MKHKPEAEDSVDGWPVLFEAGRSQIKHAQGDRHRLKKEEKKTTSSFPLGLLAPMTAIRRDSR